MFLKEITGLVDFNGKTSIIYLNTFMNYSQIE